MWDKNNLTEESDGVQISCWLIGFDSFGFNRIGFGSFRVSFEGLALAVLVLL